MSTSIMSTPIMPTPTMQSFNEDEESKREAFYEELNERLLAIEYGEYDCGQCSEEDMCDWKSQYSFDEGDEDVYEEKENCEICEEVLVNHVYGNVCKKHIPSYALYDDEEDVDMEGYITQEGMDDTDVDDTDMDTDE
jgi:hypothetical protein